MWTGTGVVISDWYRLGLVLLASAVVLAIYAGLLRRLRAWDLAIVALAWWAAACGAAPTAANAGGLAPVWWALVVFFVARAVGSCGTLWWYELGPLAVARGRSGAALGLGAAAT